MALSWERASGPLAADVDCAAPASRFVMTNLPSDSRRIALADEASRDLLSEQSRMMSSLGQTTGLAAASTGKVSSQMWSPPPRARATASVDFPEPDAPRKARAPPPIRTALPCSHVIDV